MMENKTKIDLKNKSIFITGVAGFIGSNLAKRLLSTVEGVKVVGLDNMNNYYDVRLKEARLKELEQFEKFSFVKGNLADKAVIESIFEQYKPEIVVNLGAQAGVRYSITNPDAYVEANLIGFYNILEACRHSYDEGHTPVEHLVYRWKFWMRKRTSNGWPIFLPNVPSVSRNPSPRWTRPVKLWHFPLERKQRWMCRL